MWEGGSVTLHDSLDYYQESKLRTRCLCLPLKYGVLVIGLLGCIVNVAGMVAYGILQVPSIREKMMEVFSLGMDISVLHKDVVLSENYRKTKLIYTLEITGVLSGMCLGILVNILLVVGVNKWKRWFLLHWLIYHLLLLVVLFVLSVIFFSVEIGLRKLFGVVPVIASFFFMYCWSKVYELFCFMSLFAGGPCMGSMGSFCDVHPHMPPYCIPVQYPHIRDSPDEDEVEDDIVHGGTEFYPVDPLSRGMMDRQI